MIRKEGESKKLVYITISVVIILIASAIIFYLQKTNVITGNVIEPLSFSYPPGVNSGGNCPVNVDYAGYTFRCEDQARFCNDGTIYPNRVCRDSAYPICCRRGSGSGGGGGTNPQPQDCPIGQITSEGYVYRCIVTSSCRTSNLVDFSCPNQGEKCCQTNPPQPPTPTNTECSRGSTTIIGDITYTNLRCTTSSSCRTSSRFNEIKLDAFGVICAPSRFGRQRICCGKKPAEPTNPIPPSTEPNPTDNQCSGNIIENSITYSLSCSRTTRCINGEKINGKTGCGTTILGRPKACCKTEIDYGQSEACTNNLGGTCQDSSTKTCNGEYIQRICPGPNNWQCCAPTQGEGTGTCGEGKGGESGKDCSLIELTKKFSIFAEKSCISKEKIKSILENANSPAVDCYDEFVTYGESYGIDPTIALGFFRQESSFGIAGRARYTKSIGNIKYSNDCKEFGGKNINGFCGFDNWCDSVNYWYHFIKGSGYVGSGLVTVDDIIRKYAPIEDGNNVKLYTCNIKEWAQEWRDS